ncbi:MAG: 3,4-dihydroxy-2-butanone-4-phosphate synthase [Saprospiraceae bacterium]|nr:3,4-dihydroxy-2-butanone-4-phosphate synthase [Saprospiraceae bacterium]
MTSDTSLTLSNIDEALQAVRAGEIIIVVDDEDRENEGDFICAAEMVTPEMINFMATHGRGLICTPMDEKRADELDLPLMVRQNTALHETAFTVSIDLIGRGCTTGISAYDRATGIRAIVDQTIRAEDFARPGHIFPLRAKTGGVLRRTGHTEAAIDLARLAGFSPVGVLVEILNEDGSMARLPQLCQIAERFGLKIISIADLVAYRLQRERLIQTIHQAVISSPIGELAFTVYEQLTTGDQHLAIRYGSWGEEEVVPVRVQSALSQAEIRQVLEPHQADLLNQIMSTFQDREKGLLVVMHHRDKMLDLVSSLKMWEGKPDSQTQQAMDQRDFGIGAQIIRDQGIRKLALLTNNTSSKRIGLDGYGLEISHYLPI